MLCILVGIKSSPRGSLCDVLRYDVTITHLEPVKHSNDGGCLFDVSILRRHWPSKLVMMLATVYADGPAL